VSPAELRREFIDFFRERGHTCVAPASLIPPDDPTLLFTNAGMNQFKDLFLGTGTRQYRRAANSQKCIRVSGKHNDLEEVGRDVYHHTFFEMLGNWSFGDYFKAEAIQWAWQLLTEVWGLPKGRLYVTVYSGDEAAGVQRDDEAARLWTELTDVDPSHIRYSPDTFWEMGDVGPCGPNSEIHIDLTPDRSGGDLVDVGDARVIELWNLVFIQYNRNADGSLTQLPARHVDTGLGFERVCEVFKHLDALRNDRPFVFSNYGSDLFVPLICEIEQMAGWRYGARAMGTDRPERYDANDPRDLSDVACRVIADHTRMLTFAMTDGALPGNEGRGYVVRRILRRAARFGRQHLGLTEPFLHQLVPTVVRTMGEAFPELTRSSERIVAVIREEEASFGRTLDRGIQLFQQAAGRAQAAGAGRIEADDAFKLYDTYGFPLDLTVQMAGELGLGVDEEGFETLMDQARQKARAAARDESAIAFEGELPATTDQLKYLGPQCRGRILGWVEGNRFVDQGTLEAGTEVGLMLDQTCFYGEQGGQVGDQGTVSTDSGLFRVRDTRRLGTGVVHVGQVERGQIIVGQPADLAVDDSREQTRRNHTGTHLLHLALTEVLGEQVTQRGSLVEPGRLRFDFDHSQGVSAEQVARVERIVNGFIWADHPVRWYEKPRDQALKLEGLRAFFGDKYGEVVRVVEVGDGLSRELCGGTHVQRTGQIGVFKIVSEEGVAKGVRRITAVTGMAALEHVQEVERSAREAAGAANTSVRELPARVADLQAELRQVRRQLQKGQSADVAAVRRELLTAAERIGRCAVVVGELPGVPAQQLRESVDWLRTEAGSAAVVLGSRQNADNVLLVVGLTEDMVGAGLHAGDLIKQVAPIVGGGGGGKPGMAQAGGKKVDALGEALDRARQIVLDQMQNAS